MVSIIRNSLFPSHKNKYRPYIFKRSVFASIIIFLIIINSFSAIFFTSTRQAVASAIDTARLVELTNQERIARGLSTLIVDQRLVTAAVNKGQDMFAKQYWAHYGPNGETPWQFIKAAGYNYVYAGENLAKDFTSTDPIHTAWMNSPSHRDNIINTHYQHIGIAAIDGIFDGKQTTIVVQMFGSEYVAPTTPAPAPTPQPEAQPQPAPTSPSPTPSPQPPPDTTAPDKPVITEPKDGDLLNISDINIKGTAESKSEVAIYDGEERIGTLNADGGAFDYRVNFVDGEHILGATATDSAGNVSERSDSVGITIDTVAPEIKSNTFKLLGWNERDASYDFEIIVAGEPVKVTAILKDYSVELEKSAMDYWGANFSPDKMTFQNNNRAFTLIAQDLAGNESETAITIPEVDIEANNLQALPKTGEAEKSILGAFLDRIVNFYKQSSLVQKINLFAGIFLLILAIVDVYILWKRGIKRKGGSSASHIPILVLLIIAILFAISGLIL